MTCIPVSVSIPEETLKRINELGISKTRIFFMGFKCLMAKHEEELARLNKIIENYRRMLESEAFSNLEEKK